MNIEADAGDEFRAFLTWDDWASPSQDFIFQLRDNSLTIIRQSDNFQTSGFPPIESLTTDPINPLLPLIIPTTGTYHLSILEFSSTGNENFDLFVTTHRPDQYNVPSGSIPNGPDAVGAFIVGATNVNNDQLESFSSRGPTNDNRIRPDLTAPNRVSTSFGAPSGTSFSAPHVAGAAALVLDKFPGSTPDSIQQLLEQNTFNNHPKNNNDGTGRIDVSFLNVGLGTNGVFRPGDGRWFLDDTPGVVGGVTAFKFGSNPTLLPITGDWDGDGKDTIGVFRPGDGRWFLDDTPGVVGGVTAFKFGSNPTLLPITGDWDRK